jgi:hypothetical protein
LLLTLSLPIINPNMTEASIDAVYIEVGANVRLGSKLVDLIVDLSAAVPHDCPPISYYRLLTQESACLRRIDVGRGGSIAPGTVFALFSTDPEESLDSKPARQIRVSVAGIIKQEEWPEF